MPKDWEAMFPHLRGRYTESSDPDRAYTCAAFAVGDTQRWWDPLPPGLYYWPDGVERKHEASAYVAAFRTAGFETCADGSLEQGIEKIAIYANEWGMFEHAARQLSDGRWTSKIAEDEDIIHDTLDLLIGDAYGRPVHFMARPLNKQG